MHPPAGPLSMNQHEPSHLMLSSCSSPTCPRSAAAISGNEERQALRQKCYERCMRIHGWKPVCVFSPRFPKPTAHMPEARWVMPNFCTMKCQERYARYQVSRPACRAARWYATTCAPACIGAHATFPRPPHPTSPLPACAGVL